MHELSIAEGIIEIVERTANANHVRHVKTVRVSIGELAGVDIPSLEFAWQSVRKGGVAQNAELEIERPRGEAWCLQCQKTIPLHRYGDPCPDCGGKRLRKEALAVTVGGISIDAFCRKSVNDALAFVDGLELTPQKHLIADRILKEIKLSLIHI